MDISFGNNTLLHIRIKGKYCVMFKVTWYDYIFNNKYY